MLGFVISALSTKFENQCFSLLLISMVSEGLTWLTVGFCLLWFSESEGLPAE